MSKADSSTYKPNRWTTSIFRQYSKSNYRRTCPISE